MCFYVIQKWMFRTIHFWMVIDLPKLDVLYHPNLDDSEHACKSSKSGCFVMRFYDS